MKMDTKMTLEIGTNVEVFPIVAWKIVLTNGCQEYYLGVVSNDVVIRTGKVLRFNE